MPWRGGLPCYLAGMCATLSLRAVLATAVALTGCGAPSVDPFSDTSSSAAAGGGSPPADAGGGVGEVDAQDPCATLTAPGMPEASVAWVIQGDPEVTCGEDVAIDWRFTYAVNVPEGESALYSLELERCTTFASHVTQCEWALRRVPDGCDVGSIRFGMDPSTCPPGDSVHELTLRLRRRLRIVSEDSFSMRIHHR